MRRIALYLCLAVILAGYTFYSQYRRSVAPPAPQSAQQQEADALLQKAFDEKLSNLQVEGRGVVTMLLPDDNKGSRHQRFVLRLASGQTLLVAHNIDLAPRIDSLAIGDEVAFSGEYEWNSKGGVLHWTHRDPDGRHAAGWLRHRDRTYQ
ncbi:MAG: DUF3465 domain-containing protein [Desulfobulbaceae bacterium]|nr:MAG: DUF3465 domain-containing protein [Desulfobulbaceae bacterium]